MFVRSSLLLAATVVLASAPALALPKLVVFNTYSMTVSAERGGAALDCKSVEILTSGLRMGSKMTDGSSPRQCLANVASVKPLDITAFSAKLGKRVLVVSNIVQKTTNDPPTPEMLIMPRP